jgi:hypothetical protein
MDIILHFNVGNHKFPVWQDLFVTVDSDKEAWMMLAEILEIEHPGKWFVNSDDHPDNLDDVFSWLESVDTVMAFDQFAFKESIVGYFCAGYVYQEHEN